MTNKININTFNLENKYALITGAAGLLGEQHARSILEINGSVVLVDINLKKLKVIHNKLSKDFKNKRILIFKMDVTSENSIKGVIRLLKKKKIFINILINNAALNPKPKTKISRNNLEIFSLKEWEKEIDVGLTGYFLCTKYFGHEMSKQKKGVILNISSDLSVISPDQRIYKNKKVKKQYYKPITYSVIKTAITGLTRYTATYWANKNIRCNSLSPGGIYNNQDNIFLANVKKLIPLNRLARRDEYKSSVKYLCSEASSYMTGQNIVVDGGRSVW